MTDPSMSNLHWRQLYLPPVVAPAAAQAVLTGLANLPGRPRLVLEALASAGRVSWRLGSNEMTVRKAARVIQAHLPETLVMGQSARTTDPDQLLVAGQIRLSRSRHLPLAADSIDATARGLLAVFASTGERELLRLQLVLGGRTTPRRAPQIDGLTPSRLAGKHSQHGFGACLRLAAFSGQDARARQLVASAAGALRGLEALGVSLRLQPVSRRAVRGVRSPWLWPLWLSTSDLVPLLGWPIASDPDSELPALPPRHPRLMPALPVHPGAGRSLAIATIDLQQSGRKRLVAQAVPDGLQHTHVMGLTGTGKSTLLAHMVLSDASAGRGAVVIDPKGDLVDDLLARIPRDRLDDVVVLDARDQSPVGINPLHGADPDLAADSVLAVFHSLYSSAWGPRTSDLLHGCLLTLARRGDASLVMVPLLLTNPGFRRSIIGSVVRDDPLGLGSFWATFHSWSDAEREHNVQPLLNKLRQILLRPALRGVFGQRQPRFQIQDVFTKQRLLLVALGKGTIGAEAAQLLGSLVVSHLWQATTQRIATPQAERAPVQIYVDEVQDYLRLPTDLGDALAQARGLGVGFTLSHQELGQLGPLRSAVMANTRSRILFQIAPDDASQMATAFGTGVLSRDDFRALPAYQAYAQLLVAGTTAPWVSLSTQPLPDRLRRAETLRARSAARYGQALSQIEADLLGLIGHSATASVKSEPGPTPAADRPDRGDLGRRRTRTGGTS